MVSSAVTHTHPVPSAVGLPRLLGGLSQSVDVVDLGGHLDQWGALPRQLRAAELIDEVEASGLCGHGGAAFPVATKWRSVRGGGLRRPVVVANGSEGEPASVKDRLLVERLPHLVLDGAALAARAVGATRVVLYVGAGSVERLESTIARRRAAVDDPVAFEVVAAPHTFLAGQETAVVNALNRGDARPLFTGLQPIRRRGVAGRPTLVHNVETLAHVALIARYGAAWFRGLGTPSSPGTTLLTVSGLGPQRQVVEIPLGITLRRALALRDRQIDDTRAVLFGGYGGGWVGADEALDLPLTEQSLRAKGSSLGAGVVVLLPRSNCPLVESARVTRYLEQQGAGQCGPCVNGLAELADLMSALAVRPKTLGGRSGPILEVCDLVDGRGACRHPDGAARFARSTLSVFADHVAAHLKGGPCANVGAASVMPELGPLDAPRATGRRLAVR